MKLFILLFQFFVATKVFSTYISPTSQSRSNATSDFDICYANETWFLNLPVIPQDKTVADYQDVYNDIAKKVREQVDADSGSGRYAILARLAWHTSGTYDKDNNSGGSYGGTMIYSPEEIDSANSGLQTARDFLYEFDDKYPWLSRGDLWTLGGVVAIQESGGPKISWRPGRKNLQKNRTPDNGRMPLASKEGSYVKRIFARMGFDERETVALIGAHVLGRCHRENSGYEGAWGASPNRFTNDFFVGLLKSWHVKVWDGNMQYEDDETNSFMRLPTDMALKEESYFLNYVKLYAADQNAFFEDFSKAFTKLLELGISFDNSSNYILFNTLREQNI